jgi:hypothetical protein
MGAAKLPHKRWDIPAGKQVLRARCVKHAKIQKEENQKYVLAKARKQEHNK